MNNKDIYELMKQLYEVENEPKVGIFWYLPEKNTLLGEVSISILNSQKGNVTITYQELHKTYWQNQKQKALDKGDKDSIFIQDYTQIPRGRVFYDNGKFIVMVGSWYKQYEDKLIELLKWEFDLIDFDFKTVEYLELGRDGGEEELKYK